jgi:hypothetical protein
VAAELNLPEFEAAFDGFRMAHQTLNNALNISHFLPDAVRQEVAVLGWDIRDCCPLLLELHHRAMIELAMELEEMHRDWPVPPLEVRADLEAIQKWWREHPPAPPNWDAIKARQLVYESGRSPTSHLGLAYKTFFFLVRAYQDAMARVLLATTGQRGGGYTSMTRVLRDTPKQSEAAILIQDRLPDYRDWVRWWTSLRDQIKLGANFATTTMGGGMGVIFTNATPEGGLGVDLATNQQAHISDLASGLRMSAQLAELATEKVTDHMTDEERHALVNYVN